MNLTKSHPSQSALAGEAALPGSMVERIALILQVFENSAPGTQISLAAVCHRTGLARSTAHRILDQLISVRWLAHSTQGYELGGRLLGLTNPATGDSHLKAVAEPILRQLHQRTGHDLHLAVPETRSMRYLLKVAGPRSILPSRVGDLVPAHASALGKAYLAAIKPEAVDRIFGGELVPITARTTSSLNSLHRDLVRARQQHGLALETGEVTEKTCCLAAPLFNDRGPVASISIGATDAGKLSGLGPMLLNAARVISSRLDNQRAVANVPA